MATAEGRRESSRFWWLMPLAWLAWGLVNATRLRLVADVDWPTALAYGLPDALLWAVLTPGIVGLARRWKIRRQGLAGSLAFHGLAALAVSALHSNLDALLNVGLYLAFGPETEGSPGFGAAFATMLRHLLRYTVHINVMLYFLVVGMVHAVDSARQLERGRRRTLELEARLTEARLASLQRQLRPHFLFNTLHTVSALMGEEPEKGRRVVRRLGDLLRASLRQGEDHLVALDEELELVRAYLEVEQARFGDRLAFDLEATRETRSCRVPVLILQPMVENAVHHGISKAIHGGRVRVAASRVGKTLEIEIVDDGPGLETGEAGTFEAPAGSTLGAPADGSPVPGIGLSNTAARLRTLYGEDFLLRLEPGASAGVRVVLRLPCGEEAKA